jgi:surface protein
MNHLNTYRLKTIVNTKNKNKYIINNRIHKFYDTINFIYNLDMLLLIFIIIIPFCFNKDMKLRKLTFTYDITIKISKDGNQSILSDLYTNFPNEIIINNNTQEEKKYIYELQSGTNTIVMKWNSDLGNCNNMFNGLSNIDSIEFSNFESTNIVEMNSMFNGCSSIKSLDFSHFDTSKVAVMHSIFNGCSSL